MNQAEIHLFGVECLVLYEALEREWRLLDIVTAQEREANNPDGWALARIKVRAVRSIISSIVKHLDHAGSRGFTLRAPDAEDLRVRVAELRHRMQPPKAIMDGQRAAKARRSSAVKRYVRDVSAPVDDASAGDKLPTGGLKTWATPICR